MLDMDQKYFEMKLGQRKNEWNMETSKNGKLIEHVTQHGRYEYHDDLQETHQNSHLMKQISVFVDMYEYSV